jgi:hypothetical protein
MGSDAGLGARRRRAVNGLAKEVPPVNGMSKEDPPPRLLTLPTVLTIGRVAAVPLLIGSKWKLISPSVSVGRMDTASLCFFFILSGALRSTNVGNPWG